MSVGRRDFLKTIGLSAAAVAAGVPVRGASEGLTTPARVGMERFVFYDLGRDAWASVWVSTINDSHYHYAQLFHNKPSAAELAGGDEMARTAFAKARGYV